MQAFLKNSLFYSIIFSIFCFLLSLCIYELFGTKQAFYTEYEICLIEEKLDAFHQQPTSINTIFIGSSKSYRGIVPNILDSTGYFSSYNAAIPGILPYRYYDYLDAVMTDVQKLNTLVIELGPLAKIGTNYDAPAQINANSFHEIYAALDYIDNNVNDFWENLKYKTGYITLLLYKYTGFGIAKRLRLLSGIEVSEQKTGCVSFDFIASRGYYSLDQQVLDQGVQAGDLIKRRNKFLKGASIPPNQFFKQKGKVKGLPAVNAYTPDQLTLDLAQRIKKHQSKVENIIFLIPPRATQVKALKKQAAFFKSKGHCILDYSDPEQFPGLYTTQVSFDRAHLNERGAAYFSTLLARHLRDKKKYCR